MSSGGDTLGYLSGADYDEISMHRWGMTEAAEHLRQHPLGRDAALDTTKLLARLSVQEEIEALRPVWRAVERMLGHNAGPDYLDDALHAYNGLRRFTSGVETHQFARVCDAIRPSDGQRCALTWHGFPGDSAGHLTHGREPF